VLSMRHFLASLVVLSIMLSVLLPVAANPASADGGITIISNTAKAGFPNSVTFNLEAESAVDIVNISIECQVVRRSLVPEECRSIVDFKQSKYVTVMYILATGDIPPGTEIIYTWILQDASGDVVESAPVTISYDDARYDWQNVTRGQLTLFWYEGNDSFAQQLMTAAQDALIRLSSEFNVSLQQSVKFYIYSNAVDLQGALANPDTWTGGITLPAYNTIMIGIAEDNLDLGMRAVAHELWHLVVGQIVYSPFGTFPRWLNEGTAMNAEGEMTSDFQDRLNQSISRNTLFSVRSIASAFPTDSSEAKLCYAESYSVVRYLTDNYGSANLLALLDAFKQGRTDDAALKQVYGFDTDGLNEAWRASLGLGPQPSATSVPASTSSDFTLTAPYIVMIALVFVLSAATVVLGFSLFREWR
jgi:hypothetical protein